jgi:hypothetical protein
VAGEVGEIIRCVAVGRLDNVNRVGVTIGVLVLATLTLPVEDTVDVLDTEIDRLCVPDTLEVFDVETVLVSELDRVEVFDVEID